jgi:shikimate kinase
MSETSKTVPGSKNIYLIGFMGSGKSTVGRLLAQELQREFVDVDERVIEQAGCSISQIFESAGETGFRERESAALREVAHRENLVIALGGGAVLTDRNWELVQQTGISVYLRVRPELLHKRLESEVERPLLLGLTQRLQKITEILHQRKARYEQADLAICNEGTPEEAVAAICEALRANTQVRPYSLPSLGEGSWEKPEVRT